MSTLLHGLQAFGGLGLALSPWPGDVTLLALAATLLLLILAPYDTRLLAPVSLGCYAASLTNSAFISFPDLRLPAGLLALYLAVLRSKLPRLSVLRRGMFPASFTYLTIAAVLLWWSADLGNSLAKIMSTLLAIVYAWLLICAAEPDELRRTVRSVTSVLALGSIVLVVLDPSAAIEGNRWRGLLENANGLGLVAAFYFLSAKPRSTAFSLLSLGAILVGTASRASAFGVALVASPHVLKGQSRLIRRSVAGIALVAALPLLYLVFYGQSDAVSTTNLARVNNSRASTWGIAVDDIAEKPFTGRGMGNATTLVPSSVLRPMVEVGVVALVPLGLTVVVCIRVLRSPSGQMRSIFLFLFINGIFEGWLFAGGSVLYVVFLLSAAVATEPPSPSPSESVDGELVSTFDTRDVMLQ